MTELITSRRRFLTGLGAALITAPAIVRAGSLMPVKPLGRWPMPKFQLYSAEFRQMMIEQLWDDLRTGKDLVPDFIH